jgi:hypothetical protein
MDCQIIEIYYNNKNIREFCMFYLLILSNFVVAALTSVIIIFMFSKSINNIMARVINDSINTTWAKYTKFAGLVVGISSGIRIYEMEKYITPINYYNTAEKSTILELTTERWFLEIFRTLVETVQGLAWMFFVFFVISLLAYVVVRVSELKYAKKETEK